ncbi:MAG TPA: sulfite exporter TauE/SafE family protein [Caulobacteraceae bacterium]|nr:sulfite exporter TauE/SafE family protein [Caulobacteraceae bacterium]
MDLLTSLKPLYALSGFVVGVLVGLTGVGGGSLMTPLLVLLFGVHPTTAVGTDLLYAAATKTVGTGVHGFKRTVQWSIVGRLAIGSVPATAVTLWFLSRQGKHAASADSLVTTALGAALIVTAIAVLFRKTIVAFVLARTGELSPRYATGLTILLGAVLGVLVSLTSVGAGALGMTVLLILYPKADIAKLVGSDIAHAVPLTLLAGLGHWMMGSVDWRMLVSLLSGSIPGIILGSLLAARTPDGVLRTVLAAVLVVVGVKMLT